MPLSLREMKITIRMIVYKAFFIALEFGVFIDSHSREVFQPIRSRRTRSDVKSAVQKGNTGSLEKDSSPGTKRWDILYMKVGFF